MKGQFDFFINDPAFGLTSYVSDWYNVSNYTTFDFMVLCSVNCDQVIEYSYDQNFEIVKTDTYSLTGGISNYISDQIVTRYIRFSIKNIASNPCQLTTQSFYMK